MTQAVACFWAVEYKLRPVFCRSDRHLGGLVGVGSLAASPAPLSK